MFAFLRRAPKVAPAIIEVPRGTKRASEVVKAEANLQAALDLLLGNVVLAESLKDARQLRKTLPAGLSIVTRKGEVLKSAGTITLGDTAGDATSSTTSFLAQQREWKELPARIDEATKVATTILEAHEVDSALYIKAPTIQALNEALNHVTFELLCIGFLVEGN